MTPANLVRNVEAAGGHFSVAGDRIAVSAPRPLPGQLVNELREHKLEVLAYLKRGADAWDAANWRVWISERAAVLEFDGGLPRYEAESRAFQHVLIEWCNRVPPDMDPVRCAGCGKPIDEKDNDWRPLTDGATVHYGGAYGLQCWEAHGAKRRAEAVAALRELGIGNG